MHNIVRVSVALGALAGFCATASAQDRAAIEAGEQVYAEHCVQCHGERLRATGSASDLRNLPDDRPRFDKAVMEGKGQMPPWRGVVSAEELDQLWAYIRAHAR